AGRERLEYTDFYLALLAAKGITLNDPDDDGGRELTYTAKVQSSGGVSLGKAYLSQLALKPGEEVKIKVNANDVQLVPIPLTTLITSPVVVTPAQAVPAAA
ncbi:MAG: AbrB/MazE/SpoVT family DNA-binding domain-containing protein, partial [Prochlorococcaceae cyanobacterium]